MARVMLTLSQISGTGAGVGRRVPEWVPELKALRHPENHGLTRIKTPRVPEGAEVFTKFLTCARVGVRGSSRKSVTSGTRQPRENR